MGETHPIQNTHEYMITFFRGTYMDCQCHNINEKFRQLLPRYVLYYVNIAQYHMKWVYIFQEQKRNFGMVSEIKWICTFDDRTTSQFRLNLLRLCVNRLTGKCEFYENLSLNYFRFFWIKEGIYGLCEGVRTQCKKFFFLSPLLCSSRFGLLRIGYVIGTILGEKKRIKKK